MIKKSLIILFITILSTLAPITQAALIEECSKESFLQEQAELIIEGKIKKIESFEDKTHDIIYQISTISVDKYLKGSSADKEISIETLGGCISEGICMEVEDEAKFKKEEKVKVYLVFGRISNEKQYYEVACGPAGKVSLEEFTEEDEKEQEAPEEKIIEPETSLFKKIWAWLKSIF